MGSGFWPATKGHGEKTRMIEDLLLLLFKLVDIPVRPQEPALQEIRLPAGEPDAECAWQIDGY